ncbi:hypothetical protein COCON_G00074450 [Conger conger]|uniref:Beta-defensin n=1 Tax=Conger conger TaxID=82655 RepID=A0A9Q1I1Z9_CONCO|nr:hypothetical protein COCON_G00074450 [Conger conger]
MQPEPGERPYWRSLKFEVVNMKRLGLAVFLLLMLMSAVEADDAEVQYWTCGYRGLCRRFCYAQEYIVGHHGCPRRYRCCAVRN